MNLNIAGRICGICGGENPEWLILQPVAQEELDEVQQAEFSLLGRKENPRVMFVCFAVENWNAELSPWTAPPVWGKEGFAGRAEETLDWLEKQLLPQLPQNVKTVLGGYSLAGLFSLWAGSQTSRFDAVVGASPSVWFPDYLEYEAKNPIQAKAVYLSLGKREEKTKNRAMVGIGSCIRDLDSRLDARGVCHLLEWNEGNHFCEPEIRTAKGFCWAMEKAQFFF